MKNFFTVAALCLLTSFVVDAAAQQSRVLLEAEVTQQRGTTEAELDIVLEAVGSPEYIVATSGELALQWGAACELSVTGEQVHVVGECYESGALLPVGLYLAVTAVHVAESLDDGEPLELPAGGIVQVLPTARGDGASVGCKNGYYACCYVDRKGNKKARCRPDSAEDEDCEAGGKGSTSCAWTEGSISPAQLSPMDTDN